VPNEAPLTQAWIIGFPVVMEKFLALRNDALRDK
jgi:hypothetical protein